MFQEEKVLGELRISEFRLNDCVSEGQYRLLKSLSNSSHPTLPLYTNLYTSMLPYITFSSPGMVTESLCNDPEHDDLDHQDTTLVFHL